MAVPGERVESPTLPGGVVGGSGASAHAAAEALARLPEAGTLLIVEGITDQIALAAISSAGGRDLAADGVLVAPIGGAHAIGRVLTRVIGNRPGLRLADLCDRREEAVFRDALAATGIASPRTREDMERLGFFVCVDDLEQELIRAVGVVGVLDLFDSQRDLRSFRAFQKQPAWRGRPIDAQLYRFVRSVSERNLRYAGLLASTAARQGTVPRPLAGLLDTAR
ncbi:hypothetical protein GCM10027059_27910 [Myceligenerans halotolerans]